MLSKKYYIEIAKQFGKATDLQDLFNSLTDMLHSDNYRFDYYRFKEYTNNIRKQNGLPPLGE